MPCQACDSSKADFGAMAGIDVDKEAGLSTLATAWDCTLAFACVTEDEEDEKGLVSQSTTSSACCGWIA